jgi:[CysO sulfur-carrier protein]-S-L-cysteine hydrolase
MVSLFEAKRYFRIKKGLEVNLLEHADREAPRECCGLLAGRRGVAGAHFSLPNISSDAERSYFAEPQALFDAVRTIRHSQSELLGIYHSHPKSSPVPSQTDIEQAYYPDCAYVIIGPRECEMRIKAYQIDKEHASELVVEWV